MDGDRPVVDKRDIFESKLQGFVRGVFEEGWQFCNDGLPDPSYALYSEREWVYKKLDEELHELLISYLDGPTSDVGAQDETPKEGEMGHGVRSEAYFTLEGLSGHSGLQITQDTKIEFAKETELNFVYHGKRIAIGNCELERMPDGSIHASIEYYPQAEEKMGEFMEGFDEGIRDMSVELEANKTFQDNLSELKKTFRYSFKEFDDILPSTKPKVNEAF